MADQSDTPKVRYKRLRSPVVPVVVAQRHIDTAIPKDSNHCMIADAIREAHPTFRAISVDTATIRFTDPEKKLRYVYLTPSPAIDALIDFDEGRAPAPFSFELRRAAQITSVWVYEKKGTRRKRPALNLFSMLGRSEFRDGSRPGVVAGRRRDGSVAKFAQDEGRGCVPTIIGGATPHLGREPEDYPGQPRNHRKKRIRHFGRRGYATGENKLVSG